MYQKNEIAFLKELISINDIEKRQILIKKLLVGDSMTIERLSTYNKISSKAQTTPLTLKNVKIRPGCFMNILNLAKKELSQKGKTSKHHVNRLSEIWLESIKILEEIAFNNY